MVSDVSSGILFVIIAKLAKLYKCDIFVMACDHNTNIPVTFLLILIGALSGLWAQPERLPGQDAQIIRQKSVLLQEVDTMGFSISNHPTFSNVNRVPYFYDARLLAEIERAEKNDQPYKLRDLLAEYINQFGIENFQRNVALLWKAGEVNHALQDTVKAVFYYELALRHHHGKVYPDFAVDNMPEPPIEDWLDIDKYYELLEVRRKIDPLIRSKKVLTSMGEMINSPFPDYAPSMHRSDSVLIFTSRREVQSAPGPGAKEGRFAYAYNDRDFVDPFLKKNEDLYFSQIDFTTGKWTYAEKFSDSINTQFNEGSACLSPDGRTLYFTRCNAPGSLGDCDIYSADYDAGKWVNIRNLGPMINSSSWDSQPNISADGNILFFTSNRPGGFGGNDLYYTERDEKGKWGKAWNLGPFINSPSHEVTPFFHRINRTLFFSSTGQYNNFGGYDIFRSRWLGAHWEDPLNVGPLINTRGNEYYFSIDRKGETIFYARSEDQEVDHVRQNFDLYSFPMPMEARPDAVANLKGVLLDSVSGYPLTGMIMVIDLDKGIEVAPKKINEKGYFEFLLKNNNKYRIYVLGDNFLTIKHDIVLRGDTTFEIITRSLEQGKPIVFEKLEFGSNSDKLRASIQPQLDYIVKFLERYPMYRLSVEGHTDSDGAAEYNLSLSERRAEKIANYIIVSGSFDVGRVTAKGYGETKPLVPNDTDENKRKNRRVEFKLILDESYEGEMWLPTEEELFYNFHLGDEHEMKDPDEETESDEFLGDEWMEELEMEDEIDLDEELNEDILEDLKKDN